METARWKGGLDDPAAQEATMQTEVLPLHPGQQPGTGRGSGQNRKT